MQRILHFAIVAFMAIALPLGMMAQQQGGRGNHDLGRLKTELGLTEQQTTQIKDVLKEARASRPDVKDMTKEERFKAMREHREAVDAKIGAILTAEQQTKYKALKEQTRQRMLERRGKQHGRD